MAVFEVYKLLIMKMEQADFWKFYFLENKNINQVNIYYNLKLYIVKLIQEKLRNVTFFFLGITSIHEV